MKGQLFIKPKFYIICLVVVAFAFSTVCVSANSLRNTEISNDDLPSEVSISNDDLPNYEVLQVQLEDYIGTRPGKVSVYVKDLTTGKTLKINSDEIYAAASTIKLPLVLYVYELAAQDQLDLDAKLTYTPEFYAQGTGILQAEPFGGQYAIRELSRLSIVYSDNVAWKMLLGFIGQDKLTEYEKALGARTTGEENGLYITTPEDMGVYLERLLAFSKEKPQYGHEILNYMANSVFSEGIPQNLPDNIVVAHKMGALNDKFHDVGIVFGKKPYIIAIFTDGAWEEVSLQTLADISRIIYDFQESL